MKEEVKILNGRTRRVAKQEAIWKWRNQLLEERKAELLRRKVNRGEVEQMVAKKARKARKAKRIQQKLTELVLIDAPNQVIPGQPSTSA